MVYTMIFTGVSPSWAANVCTEADLADVPLELLMGVAKVPSILMISLDNSDTMDYGVMTNENTATKQFTAPSGTVYGYILSGPNATGGAALEDSVNGDKNAWKSQWCKENKMYYNPQVDYAPWPTKADSNVTTPTWDPRGAGTGTYDLTQSWMTITYADPAGVPVIVDNTDAGWYSNNYGDPSSYPAWSNKNEATAWNGSNFVGENITANNRGYYNCYWNFSALDSSKKYSVEAWFDNSPNAYQRSTNVHYWVLNNTGWIESYRNQRNAGGKWVSLLAPNTFVTNMTSSIVWIWHSYTEGNGSNAVTYYGHKVTKPNEPAGSTLGDEVCADAVRFVPVITDTITRRHFYMKSTDAAAYPDPYLIDLTSADSAKFFKLVDANNNGLGDSGEYQKVLYANLPPDIRAIIPAPGVGAYTEQLQNFANWVTYHSRRMWAAVNAVAILVTEANNMLVGMQTSPPSASQGKTSAVWINTTFDGSTYDMTADFLNVLYNIPDCHSNRGFSEDLTDLGDFFEKVGGTIASNNDKDIYSDLGYATTSASGSFPYFTEEYGGSCQQAYSLVITDGASPSTANIKNYDGEGGEYSSTYDGGIFGDAFTKTAADGAMQYYERDLKANLSNNVPTNYIDLANHQHMVTYGLSFGVQGPLRAANPDFNALCAGDPPLNTCKTGCTCPTWKSPSAADFNVLDDLWHATINGRGLFFYADNPEELINALRLIKADIDRRVGSAAAVSTNAVQRQVGTMLFQGMYNSQNWSGDLVAKNVDVGTGAISGQQWSAAEQMLNILYTDRKVFTFSGGSAMDFTAANAGSLGMTAEQVNYLLGDDSNEVPDGLLRPRIITDHEGNDQHFKLGDVAHSEPFYYDGVVYIGANDGMLHAFNADNGIELFGYVPGIVLGDVWKIADTSFIDNHQFYVDATPHVYSAEPGVQPAYLAGGLGKGGKGIYCLKVDNAATPAKDDIVNWEYSDPADTSLGYVYGRAYVAKTSYGTVVIFGNGHVSDSHKAVLYVLDAATGAIVKKFDTGNTGTDGCNGMSSPALIDYNADGTIEYVYAGDLDGNIWKFDLRNDSSTWHTSYGGAIDGTGGNPLFTARDAAGHPQPITCEPDVMKHCDPYRAGVVVVFGTGQYLGENDLGGQVASQYMYGIYDWELDLIKSGVAPDPADYYLGSFGAGGVLSHVTLPGGAPAKLLMQEKADDILTYRTVTNNPITYYDPYKAAQDAAQTHLGWYYVLPDASERVVRDPLIRNGVVYFVSNTVSTSFCSGSGGGWLYALNACSGGATYAPQFDINGDKQINEGDTVVEGAPNLDTDGDGIPDAVDANNDGIPDEGAMPTGMYFDTTLFDPFALQDHIYINDTFGNIIDTKVPPNPPGVRYWRIIE